MNRARRTLHGFIASAVAALAGCAEFYDAAPAIAYDLEAHTCRAAQSVTTTLVHVPRTSRGGCADAYRVQSSQAAGMVVWCYAPDSATAVVSSHGSTYQLRFVDVPETTIVGQQRGEPLSIEIEHGPGKSVVRRLS